MNILVTGSTGLVGSALVAFLSENQHRVLRLVRRTEAKANEVCWNPQEGKLDPRSLERLDAVVHLAGESIAAGRWTPEKKQRIRESRIKGTQLLAQSLSRLYDPPKVFISVSAVGYYGDRGDERLDEGSDSGNGFLAELCREWEAATQAAVLRGIRVAIPRVGMVLNAKGGALSLMLPVFRMGVGGRIGSGRQYISWITLPDLVGVLDHAIRNPSLSGPVNAVSPNPATNREFSETLGRVLSRPAHFVLPRFAARLAFGEMADETILSGARVFPEKLLHSGYRFQSPDLEGALRQTLQKTV